MRHLGSTSTPLALAISRKRRSVVARLEWDHVHEGPLQDPRRQSICDRQGDQGRFQKTGTQIPSRSASGRQGGGGEVQGYIGFQRSTQRQGEASKVRCG